MSNNAANPPDTATTTPYMSLFSDDVFMADLFLSIALNLFTIFLSLFSMAGWKVRLGYFMILIIIISIGVVLYSRSNPPRRRMVLGNLMLLITLLLGGIEYKFVLPSVVQAACLVIQLVVLFCWLYTTETVFIIIQVVISVVLPLDILIDSPGELALVVVLFTFYWYGKEIWDHQEGKMAFLEEKIMIGLPLLRFRGALLLVYFIVLVTASVAMIFIKKEPEPILPLVEKEPEPDLPPVVLIPVPVKPKPKPPPLPPKPQYIPQKVQPVQPVVTARDALMNLYKR